MIEKKFDVKKPEKLNNPDRLLDIAPEYIWSKINMENPKVLVDIGAGTGFFSVHFRDHAKNAKFYACDISEAMVEWMKNNVCPGFPDLIPLRMKEDAVPLENGIADLVYMLNLHHELDKPEKILAEAFRILKNNGIIFIVDWKKEDMPQGPPAQIRYFPEQIKAQLLDAGFKNIRIFDKMKKHFLLIAEK